MGVDLLEFAVPEIAYVVAGRKKFKTTAKNVGRQTMKTQLGSRSTKQNATRVVPAKSAKQTSQLRREIVTNISR